MSKKIKAKLWDKILSVLGAGGESKDKFLNKVSKTDPQLAKSDKFLNKVSKTDPQLAKSLEKWESSFIDLLQVTKRIQQKHNRDTSTTDKLIKKYRGY
jgi:hypothetical protein